MLVSENRSEPQPYMQMMQGFGGGWGFFFFFCKSLCALQNILRAYSAISGYKVNEQMSVISVLNISDEEKKSKAIWRQDNIKNLGIRIGAELGTLTKINVDPYVETIRQQLG